MAVIVAIIARAGNEYKCGKSFFSNIDKFFLWIMREIGIVSTP